MLYDIITQCIGVGRNEQIEILSEYKHRDDIRQYFKFMLCPSYNFYTKKVNRPDTFLNTIKTVSDLNEEIYCLLDHRPILRGKDLEFWLNQILYNCTEKTYHLMKWVIDRKNPAKIGKTIVNKIWPGTIRTVFYQGAVPGTTENIDRLFSETSEVMLEIKEDGMALLVDYEEGKAVAAYSRQGEDLMPYVQSWLDKLPVFPRGQRCQVHFELFVTDGFAFLDRKTGNGLINKAVKSGNVDMLNDKLVGVALDVHPLYNCTVPAIARYEILETWLDGCFAAYPVCMSIVCSREEAESMTKMLIAAGREGAVLKHPDKPSKNGKPWYSVKMKHEFTVDLEVIDTKPHSKKPDELGALLMASSCRELQVWVNLRCDDDRRLSRYFIIGDILRVKSEKISSSKSKKTKALFLPRFDGESYLEYTTDKITADSLKSIEEQYQASVKIN